MMVSIFPYDMNSAPLADVTKKITLSVKYVSWRVVTTITAPTTPDAAIAPDAASAS